MPDLPNPLQRRRRVNQASTMPDALKCYVEPRAILGEAPLWDVESQRLYWVDCDRKKLFHLDGRTQAIGSVDLPGAPGSYALRAGGGMIMAYRNQLALLNADMSAAQVIETDADFSVERFNDGACDRSGRFWVGTMDRRMKEPVGSLFRVDRDLTVTGMASGFTTSNGIAFSPDDKILYHTDTGAAKIYAHDFDIASGTISNGRLFADFAGTSGKPDGCTMDCEGHLWVAAVGSGSVVRLDPNGRRVNEIRLPVTRPTSVILGGAGLRTLYVTTMQFGLSAEQLAAQPQSGCLFAIDVEVPGLPEPRFADTTARAAARSEATRV